MSNGRYMVAQEFKSKAEVKKGFYAEDLIFVVLFFMMSYMVKDYVASSLQYPFLACSLGIAIFLRTPSPYNKRRRTMESFVIYFKRDQTVYRPFFKSNITTIKKENNKKAVHPTTLDHLDIRRYDSEHKFFQRKDGSYMDLIKIKTRDRANTSEDDIKFDVLKLMKLLQTYEDCMKIMSLNFPTNTVKQQEYYKKKIEQCKNAKQRKWLTVSLRELEWIDKNTTEREYYIVYYAPTLDKQVNINQQILNKLQTGQNGMLEELPQQKKEDIYFKLMNPSSIVRNPAYD